MNYGAVMSWPQISAAEAARALRDTGAVYLDVRTLEEFELGHVLGAYHVPWLIAGEPNAEFTSIVLGAFGREQSLIVGCQSGQRSGPACAALLSAGAAHVSEQHGGYGGKRDAFGRVVEAGWERAGLPVATHALPGHSYRDLRALALGS